MTLLQQTGKPGNTLRLGIIGASAERGWAAMGHIPAIQAVPTVTLQAVATRSERSARAAADAFGAPLWFDNASTLIAHADVDAIVVAVKAPDHYPLVKQALLANKPVYCEWPLGHTLAEARELSALAQDRGVPTAVGLQGRYSPWLAQVRDIVAAGTLGRILSTSLIAYDELSVGSVDQGNAYLLDVTTGANPLTIQCGHYLDALCVALGELDTVSATTAISRPRVTVRQTGEVLTPTSPDQIAFSGRLDSGAIVSFHMRAGSGDPSFLWEIQGDRASLRITSKGYLMWRPCQLELWDPKAKTWQTLAPLALTGQGRDGQVLEGPAWFVALAYEAFAEDVLTGSRRSITFADALVRQEAIEAIRMAALGGGRTARWQG